MPDEPTAPEPTFFERLTPRLSWVVFAIALLLRLAGIGWGLPNEERHWSYHPDEPVIYLYAQNVEPAKFDFEPGFYNYGTLYLTLLRIAGDVAKTYSGAGDQVWAQAGAAHVAGRLISAAAGAGAAVVVFLMLRRRFETVGALFGAGLVAFAPGFVIHSRFQTVDVLATFFLVLGAHHALRLLPDRAGATSEGKDALKAALLSGVFVGLSAGTKYTGILGLITLVVVLLLARRKEAGKLFGIGSAAALVVFLLATPGVFLNTAKFIEDFRYEIQHTGTGHGIVFAGLPSGFLWHFYNLLIGVGPLMLALGLLGLVWASIRRDPAGIALAAFFLVYYVLIGRAEVLFLRYTFPLLIGLAFGFGWVVDRFWGRPGWARTAPAAAILGLGGIFGGGLASSGVASMWMLGDDPRDEAARLFTKEITHDGEPAVVGVVEDPWFYTPPFYPETGAPRMMAFAMREQFRRDSKPVTVLRHVPPNPDERFDWDVRLLEAEKPPYVVFSSFETEGLDRLRRQGPGSDLEKLLVERYVTFVERLKRDYTLERTYGGAGWGIHDLEYIRPFLWVWKRKGSEE